jgi:hypothetical protein
MDGNETDVDCGGLCPPCMPSQMCQVDTDCMGGQKKCINKVCQ